MSVSGRSMLVSYPPERGVLLLAGRVLFVASLDGVTVLDFSLHCAGMATSIFSRRMARERSHSEQRGNGHHGLPS